MIGAVSFLAERLIGWVGWGWWSEWWVMGWLASQWLRRKSEHQQTQPTIPIKQSQSKVVKWLKWRKQATQRENFSFWLELVRHELKELNGPPSFVQQSAASPSTTPTNRSLWRRIGGGWLNGWVVFLFHKLKRLMLALIFLICGLWAGGSSTANEFHFMILTNHSIPSFLLFKLTRQRQESQQLKFFSLFID